MHKTLIVPGEDKTTVKKITLLDRFKRAIRAFRGKASMTVECGIEVKECKKCEKAIKEAETVKVMYICNLKKCDNCAYPTCETTTDVEFAQNFRRIPGTNVYVEEEHG